MYRMLVCCRHLCAALLVGLLTCANVALVAASCLTEYKEIPKCNQTCCDGLPFKLERFEAQCGQYTTQALALASGAKPEEASRIVENYVNPCYLTCIFNVTEAWNGLDQLSMRGAAKIVTHYENPELIALATTYIRECGANVDRVMTLWRERDLLPGDDYMDMGSGMRCPWKPLAIYSCMQGKIVTHCPAALRNEAAECGQITAMLRRCMVPEDGDDHALSGAPQGLRIVD